MIAPGDNDLSLDSPNCRLRKGLCTRGLHEKWSQRARVRDPWSESGRRANQLSCPAPGALPTRASQSAPETCTVEDKRTKTWSPIPTGQGYYLPLTCQVCLWESPVGSCRCPTPQHQKGPRAGIQGVKCRQKWGAVREHMHEAVLRLCGTCYHNNWGWRSKEANRMGHGAPEMSHSKSSRNSLKCS